MKGKVFSSSQDLYQDQAKILFDFYKDAGRKNSVARRRIRKGDGRIKEFVDYECYG